MAKDALIPVSLKLHSLDLDYPAKGNTCKNKKGDGGRACSLVLSKPFRKGASLFHLHMVAKTLVWSISKSKLAVFSRQRE